MDEETLVVIRPYANLARGSSLLSDQATPTGGLGCDPAYGPSAASKHLVWGSDGAFVDDSGLTLVKDSEKVVGFNSRKRARERSVEL